MNKLIIIVANKDIEKSLTERLIDKKFRFTRINSTGGYLRKKNITLIVGVKQDRVKELIDTVKKVAQKKSSLIGSDLGTPLSGETGMPSLPIDAAPIKLGGAVLFVLPVDKIYKY